MNAPIIDLGTGGTQSEIGERAFRLGMMRRAGLPVPDGFIIAVPAVEEWARIGQPGSTLVSALATAVERLEDRSSQAFAGGRAPFLLAVRQSPVASSFGLHPTILNVGTTASAISGLAAVFGSAGAWWIRCGFLQEFALLALGAEPELFETARVGIEEGDARFHERLAASYGEALAVAGITVPESGLGQLEAVIGCLSRPRYGPPAGQAILVQIMAQEIGGERPGSGTLRTRKRSDGSRNWLAAFREGWSPERGFPMRPEACGRTSADAGRDWPGLSDAVLRAEVTLRQALEISFIVGADGVQIVGADPLRLEPKGEAAVTKEFVDRSVLSREEAVAAIDPVLVERMLHARVDPSACAEEICTGVAAAPGAAAGELVFSAAAAERLANRGGHPVLARTETNPADVGAMHFAEAVVTSRGGMTSHAAVVTRALGRPCVAGVADLTIDAGGRRLRAPGGPWYEEGAMVTVDGSSGRLLAGAVPVLPPEFDGPMAAIVDWADEFRRMGVRANADTTGDARLALEFRADGIGLCRTEHMFFDKGRIAAMREMILAGTEEERRNALQKLLPMQLGDLRELFAEMRGKPVVIRLLDPPLHEFLPRGEREMLELAERMHVPVDQVMARARSLEEFNPMLGNRGCRVGIAFPEIYEMQARAILQAAIEAGRQTGEPAQPEIMIPLVSAHREMEILKRVVDRVAAEVAEEFGETVAYRVGAMIETPRAALRSDAISRSADFLSYGTNDLTQMAFGLSRDDAGRFMPQYLRQGVYTADPFTTIDQEGVGELIQWSVRRSREVRSGIALGLCGEHGADPASLAFCEMLGIDYVSCSPFRLPVARLSAAQAAIAAKKRTSSDD